jgi:hypothetical protein
MIEKDKIEIDKKTDEIEEIIEKAEITLKKITKPKIIKPLVKPVIQPVVNKSGAFASASVKPVKREIKPLVRKSSSLVLKPNKSSAFDSASAK